MKNKMISLGSIALLLSSNVHSANPTLESGTRSIPISISGTIQEVVSCTFDGGASSGLAFQFGSSDPASEDQYQSAGTSSLVIDCTNGSSGNQYAVRMDTTPDTENSGTTPNYENRTSVIYIEIGGQVRELEISASQDGDSHEPVGNKDAIVSSGDIATFDFLAQVLEPNGATGSVTTKSGTSPALHVRFDGETSSSGGIAIAPFNGSELESIPEESILGLLDTNGDQVIDQQDF